jgi:putative ABC transport system permease protein
MIAISLKNTWAHKRRLIGTFLAVVLGVAFLSGTLLLGDTLSTNFDRLFVQANGNTDVVVRGATKVGFDPRQNARTRVDAALVGQIRGIDGVAEAEPYLQGYGQLVGRNGKGIGGNGPPTWAANWIPEPSLNPYRIVEGRAPAADDEVVINRGAAKSGDLHLGDTTTLLTPQPHEVLIVGISTFGSADGFGSSTFTGLTLDASRQLLADNPNQITEVRVAARAGVAPEELAARIQHALPTNVQAITGAQQAAENFDNLNRGFLGVVRGALLTFAIIALLVAAFSIFNTFTILVTQRAREAALLRAIGATRRQIIATNAAETAIVGVVGSAIGWVVGVGVAGGLKGVFDGFGFALPAGGLAFRPSSAFIAIGAGVLATVLAGVIPSVRASKVPPVAALRELPLDPRIASRRRAVVGGAITALGVLAVVAAVSAGSAGLGGVGAVLTVIGAVVLGPIAARPAVAVLGAPIAAARGVTGRLSRQNAQRNPRRTAASAAALMVGVTVVALFTVVGASLKATAAQGVDDELTADLVVDSAFFGGQSGGGGFAPRLADDIAAVPGVQSTTGVSTAPALLDGVSRTMTIVNPHAIAAVVDLDVRSGTVGALDKQSIAVSQQTADDHHWRVGTTLPILYPDGATDHVTIAATYRHHTLIGDYVIGHDAWTPHAAQQVDTQVYVKVAPGSDLARVRSAVAGVAKPFGNARVQGRAEFRDSVTQGVNTILGLVYVMLVLAIVIALMGIANTLSLAIYERTRELGLLRAVGQTRRQTRSMVRWESVMISVFGTVGGVLLGTFLGWALVRSASTGGLGVFAAPLAPLVIFLVVGAIAGVLAGIRPARRAARLDPLRAIAAE